MSTNLYISAQLQQTSDPNQLLLVDTTPSYTSGTPYGWNNASTDYTTNVVSVYMNNVKFYGAPSNTPPVNLGNIELMPSPNALPYELYQAYVLTPSMFGLPNFNNGLFTFDYTITTLAGYEQMLISTTAAYEQLLITSPSEQYNQLIITIPQQYLLITITDSVSNFSAFSVGDTITDTTTGFLLGGVYTVSAHSLTIGAQPVFNDPVAIGHVLFNGISSVTLSSSATFAPSLPTAGFATLFNIGQTITNSSNSEVIGIVQNLSNTTLQINPLNYPNASLAIGNTITNGTNSAHITSATFAYSGTINIYPFSVGNTITDSNTSEVIGTVLAVTANTLTINPLTVPNQTVSIGDTLTNGTNTTVVPSGTTFTYSIPDVDYSALFSVGDTISNLTTSKLIGTVLSVTTNTLTINPLTLPNQSISIGNQITNGTNSFIIPPLTTFTNSIPLYYTYIYLVQFGDATLIEGNLGKKLAQIDILSCGCDCDETKVLFDKVMKPLIISNAQFGASQNRSALNSLGIAQQNSYDVLC